MDFAAGMTIIANLQDIVKIMRSLTGRIVCALRVRNTYGVVRAQLV
jgi:hypothetical protein